jgi:hypothetical protein
VISTVIEYCLGLGHRGTVKLITRREKTIAPGVSSERRSLRSQYVLRGLVRAGSVDYDVDNAGPSSCPWRAGAAACPMRAWARVPRREAVRVRRTKYRSKDTILYFTKGLKDTTSLLILHVREVKLSSVYHDCLLDESSNGIIARPFGRLFPVLRMNMHSRSMRLPSFVVQS